MNCIALIMAVVFKQEFQLLHRHHTKRSRTKTAGTILCATIWSKTRKPKRPKSKRNANGQVPNQSILSTCNQFGHCFFTQRIVKNLTLVMLVPTAVIKHVKQAHVQFYHHFWTCVFIRQGQNGAGQNGCSSFCFGHFVNVPFLNVQGRHDRVCLEISVKRDDI